MAKFWNILGSLSAFLTLVITLAGWMEQTKRWPEWLVMPSVNPATYWALIVLFTVVTILVGLIRFNTVGTRRRLAE